MYNSQPALCVWKYLLFSILITPHSSAVWHSEKKLLNRAAAKSSKLRVPGHTPHAAAKQLSASSWKAV